MDVYVLTKGWLLDHTLVGVYSTVEAAKAATGCINWTQTYGGALVRPVAASGHEDQAWHIQPVTLDQVVEPGEADHQEAA